MADTDALYDVRERTGDPAHASVDDVIELVLERARNPREDYQDAHFDEGMGLSSIDMGQTQSALLSTVCS